MYSTSSSVKSYLCIARLFFVCVRGVVKPGSQHNIMNDYDYWNLSLVEQKSKFQIMQMQNNVDLVMLLTIHE